MQYGLIPEFIGRLPVSSAVHQLSRDDLITILTEPRNAIVKQFQRFFGFDGIELVFSQDALKAVADKALERETGARVLRSIIEEILLEVQFELPSRRAVKKCVVTKETVERGVKPTLLTERPTTALQEVALGRVLGAGDRGLVRQRRLGVAAEASQEIGADGVEEVVAVEVEAVDERERRVGPVDLGHRDGAVQRDDRA